MPAAHRPNTPEGELSGAEPAPTARSVIAHGEVIWAMAGQEVVVSAPALAAVHVLDPVAAVMWQCLDGGTPLGVVFGDIAEAFDVPVQQVQADCLPVVHSWLLAGIALQVPAPGAETAPTDAPVSTAVGPASAWRRLVDPPSS